MRWWSYLLALGAMTMLGSGAEAEVINITGAGKKQVVQCRGSQVNISGTGHTIEITDRCQLVTVTGTANQVIVQEVERVEIAGANNNVGFRQFVGGVPGREPAREISGTANQVYRLTAATATKPALPPANKQQTSIVKATAEPIVISGYGGNANQDCGGGRDVVIDAASTTITLRGMCKQVEITGMGNTVNLDGVEKIVVTGTMNKVFYRRGANNRAPVVNNTGFDNQISQVR